MGHGAETGRGMIHLLSANILRGCGGAKPPLSGVQGFPILGQTELPLPFPEPFPVDVVIFIHAAVAADAVFVFGTRAILRRQGAAAGVA